MFLINFVNNRSYHVKYKSKFSFENINFLKFNIKFCKNLTCNYSYCENTCKDITKSSDLLMILQLIQRQNQNVSFPALTHLAFCNNQSLFAVSFS